MNLRYFLALSAMTVALTACEKEIIVNVPPHESKIVVHSVTATGDTITARISRSVGIVEYTPSMDLNVTDATVLLYDNGALVDTLAYDAFTMRYVSNVVAEPGHLYTLHAQSPTLEPAFASAGVPFNASLNSIQRFENAKVNDNGGTMDELVITFNDPVESTDFYRVSLYMGDYFFYGCAQSSDPSIENPNDDFLDGDCLNTNGLYLSDLLFNGKQKELRFFVDHYLLESMPDSLGNPMEATLRFENMPEAYFQFIKTNDFAEWNYGNPFAEPSNVYNNVTNGFGVFAVVGRTEYSIP